MINVLLVDDHPSAREPLAFMLGHQHDIAVVATAGSIAETLAILADGPASTSPSWTSVFPMAGGPS